MINPGDIYWVTTKSDIAHPHVIVDIENEQITVCQITTNASKSNFPGNIVLEENEGNLPKASIVEVSKSVVVAESELGEFIGNLEEKRVSEIKSAMEFVRRSFLRE